MSQRRIKVDKAESRRRERRAIAMLKGGRYATVTVVVDNDAVGKAAIVAVGLSGEQLATFIENANGRNLETFDVRLTL